MPKSAEPQKRIDEANRLKAKASNAEVEKKYTAALKEGDQLISQKKYDEAIAAFNKAKVILPKRKEAQQGIDKARNLKGTAANAELQAKFDAEIKKGDDFLKNSNYDEAVKAYQAAKGILPKSDIPDEKIDKVNDLKNNASSAEARAKYDEFISQAKSEEGKGNLSEAISRYKEAQLVLPKEQLPKKKIAELSNQLASSNKNKQRYDEYIAKADELFEKEQFEAAKHKYTAAADLLPSESYPKEKLKEIEAKQTDVADANQKEKSYLKAISEADRALKGKDYEEAKSKYRTALEIKSSESYPQDQIKLIENIIAENKKQSDSENEALEKEKKFNDLISAGNEYFNKKDFEKG